MSRELVVRLADHAARQSDLRERFLRALERIAAGERPARAIASQAIDRDALAAWHDAGRPL